MWDPYGEFETMIMSNGLTVHSAHWPDRPWEYMGFLIHNGSNCDPVGQEGLAHFVEHLVSENSTISNNEINSFFEECGANVSLGRTGYFYTTYSFFVPIDEAIISEALFQFGYMLLLAKLENYIERERQVIIGEFLRKYPVKFKYDLEMQENKALFTGHYLERLTSSLGYPESIARIEQNDLQRFHDNFYVPANISIVGVGGLSILKLGQLIADSPFAINKPGKRILFPEPDRRVVKPLESRYKFNISKYVSNCEPVCHYKSSVRIPGVVNRHVLEILSAMLNKILNEELREKRAWNYQVNCTFSVFVQFYVLEITIPSISFGAIDYIEEVIDTCISSVINQYKLFESVKMGLLASSCMVDHSARNVCLNSLEDLSKYNRIVSVKEIKEARQLILIDDIGSVVNFLLPGYRWTLIIHT